MSFFPGQRIVASDGAIYTLTHYAEGIWWAQRLGARLPTPCVPRYPAYGADDDRVGADQATTTCRLPRAWKRGRGAVRPRGVTH